MNKAITLFLLVFVSLFASATEVDYECNNLKKELLHRWNLDISALVEDTRLSAQLISEGKVYKVLNQSQIVGYVYVGRIISCREGGCSKDKTTPVSGNYEYFDAYFIYNTMKAVETIKVFNYRATHGHEVCSKGWLKQFIGFDSTERLQVGKTIDSISGATISVNALTDEVNYITQLLRNS